MLISVNFRESLYAYAMDSRPREALLKKFLKESKEFSVDLHKHVSRIKVI